MSSLASHVQGPLLGSKLRAGKAGAGAPSRCESGPGTSCLGPPSSLLRPAEG